MSQDERVAEPMSHTIDGDSSSTSNNQAPHTPPRGRASSRYPVSLAKGDPGRVPLHRRGTSKTYERLEDLLREAGYKETRVFTPEMERAEAQAEERRKQRAIWRAREASLREGVGAVVDFFAGWIPGTSRAEDAPAVDTSIEEPNSGVSPANPLSGPFRHLLFHAKAVCIIRRSPGNLNSLPLPHPPPSFLDA
ncbi:hypothetical protein A0H81_02364 [Grifola frondosa]|uniref:Uncharacterized protein n=1 Tax=Grifola frondosa TaxID=5627 RepID=A0A1C7MNZ7_GRIFR|nr:hypothetical protein A0H81_02364 [Grifola frondosa]